MSSLSYPMQTSLLFWTKISKSLFYYGIGVIITFVWFTKVFAIESTTIITNKWPCIVTSTSGWQWDGYRDLTWNMLADVSTDGGAPVQISLTCSIREYDVIAPSASITWSSTPSLSCASSTIIPWAGFSSINLDNTPNFNKTPSLTSVGDSWLRSCALQYMCSNGQFNTNPSTSSCFCQNNSIFNANSQNCVCPVGTINTNGTCVVDTPPPPPTETVICTDPFGCAGLIGANREIDGNANGGYAVRVGFNLQPRIVFGSNPTLSARKVCENLWMNYIRHTSLEHRTQCGGAYGLTYYRDDIGQFKTDEAEICSLLTVTVIDSITCK